MKNERSNTLERRDFLKLATGAAAIGMARSPLAQSAKSIVILIPADASKPVLWAVDKLRIALMKRGATATVALGQVPTASMYIAVSNDQSSAQGNFPSQDISGPECVALAPGTLAGKSAVRVASTDARGLVFGLCELAERVEASTDSNFGLHLSSPIIERPANSVRSILRAFVSEQEDKVWYYDKEFWIEYLDVLAASRFSRFNFAFGFGHDFPRNMTSDYFQFPYPYLFEVPGYNVRLVPALAAGEQQRNLEMLQFISRETATRGLQFQVGIWTSAYKWTNSPRADHSIEGLTPETHAAYCRDAVAFLLKTCPEIQGLTLRVHGESGVPEGSYDFWRTMFQGITGCGRKIEIEMHAKGVDQEMIDVAVATGMPVKLSPKFSAEHQGLGYVQADIREMEIPNEARLKAATSTMSLSAGSRLFTRYSYGDLYSVHRKFDILFRLWAGSQRHLLWSDPATAAGYGRAAGFCGAAGIEIFEPLTYRGRDGSANPGSRTAYADATLIPRSGDWKKFETYYRLWGRHLYNPDTSGEITQRYWKKEYGASAASAGTALMHASRVIPLITSAHLPAAANHIYWPELYTNIPTIAEKDLGLYHKEMPEPECFANVSPLDPQMFYSGVEYATDLLHGRHNGKFTPVEVAQWLDEFTAIAEQALSQTNKGTGASSSIRRLEEDVVIQIALGRFFAHKMRAGVLFAIYDSTGHRHAGELALDHLGKARDQWAAMAQRAKNAYKLDISYGGVPSLRGHWIDRLPAIESDFVAVKVRLASDHSSKEDPDGVKAVAVAIVTQRRRSIPCSHTPPEQFTPGQPLTLMLDLASVPADHQPSSVDLVYRHVNHAERWKTLSMGKSVRGFSSAIPSEYTQSDFPLQYYFRLHKLGTNPWIYPTFNAEFSNQPYYAIWKRNS